MTPGLSIAEAPLKKRAIADLVPVPIAEAYAETAAMIEGVSPDAIGASLGELLARDIPPRKEVIYGLASRENGLLIGVTGHGKTTLARSIAVAVATGTPFEPVVQPGQPPRHVSYFDFEDTPEMAREDFAVMIQDLPQDQKELARNNIQIYCEEEVNGQPLTLSNPLHFSLVAERVAEHQSALTIIDTLNRAFNIRSENDNTEVLEQIMKPLKRFSIVTKSATLGCHHIGKSKSEEGAGTKEPAHRGRGASSYADQSRVIYNLEHDTANDTTTLICSKTKGKKFSEHVLRLDFDTRRYDVQPSTMQLKSSYQLVLDAIDIGEVVSTNEVIDRLAGRVAQRTVKAKLREAVSLRDLERVRHGMYQKPTNPMFQEDSAKVHAI